MQRNKQRQIKLKILHKSRVSKNKENTLKTSILFNSSGMLFTVDYKHQMKPSSKHTYCKVASSNMSCLEAHAGLFRLHMKEIFDPYAL